MPLVNRDLPIAALAAMSLFACSSSDAARSGEAQSTNDASFDDAGASANDAGADVREAVDAPNDAGDSFARSIPKFVTPLPIPAVFVPKSADNNGESYAIDVREAVQQVLPDGYPKTKVYAYGGAARLPDGTIDPSFRGWPSATFEATRGVPMDVTWTNHLEGATHMFPVDPTICWADPNDAGAPQPPYPAFPPGIPSAQSPIPIVTHLHGGEVASTSDGFPTDLTLPGASKTTHYPNTQRAATLWYHDHTLGMTRLNVLAGLAGFYLLRDPNDAVASALPSGKYEIPIVIQDRAFNADGSIELSAGGSGSMSHPYWIMEYYGDAIVVNGRTWPNLDAEPRAYRFRLLNGSNARFYRLSLVDESDPAKKKIPFTQIGTDGGYLPSPVAVDSLLFGPGERADVVVDFSAHAGKKLRFVNDANAPYPSGWSPDPETSGQIMRVSVAPSPVTPPKALPATLDTIPTLTPDATARTLTLVEPNDPQGMPLTMVLNGQMWDAPASETPRVGATEEWQIVNLGDEAHPVHLHLVNFQIVSRQPIDANAYMADWMALNGSPTLPVMTPMKPLDPTKYRKGTARGPEPNEAGWKDTALAHLAEVLTLRVRFAPTSSGSAAPGTNLYSFDPTAGPGYVWHCHILEHEDNEMMRPLVLKP